MNNFCRLPMLCYNYKTLGSLSTRSDNLHHHHHHDLNIDYHNNNYHNINTDDHNNNYHNINIDDQNLNIDDHNINIDDHSINTHDHDINIDDHILKKKLIDDYIYLQVKNVSLNALCELYNAPVNPMKEQVLS